MSVFSFYKVVFSKRSDFFLALLSDHFGEAETTTTTKGERRRITRVALREVRPEVFAEVVRHVYSDTQEVREIVRSFVAY